MEDGLLDDNEEQQIEQQLENEEQPEIKQIKNDISGDKFYIDRNGQKIRFFDPEEKIIRHNNGTVKRYSNNEDISTIIYI